MLEIDGSFGEGGGQILRTSLTLSALTGRPFRLNNIRIRRKNPGLQAQHLASVKVAKLLADAEVKGDFLGSTLLEFRPKEIQEGDFTIDIGTAGSVSLVSVTAIPLMINRRTTLRILGGTDVPLSPPIDYMRLVYLPVIEKMGIRGKIKLLRRGHYPKGGGEVLLDSFRGNPVDLNLKEFGTLVEVRGVSHVSSLPGHIARRQAEGAREVLKTLAVPIHIEEEVRAEESTGSGITLSGIGSSVVGSSSLGERGVRAETVGERSAKGLLKVLETKASLDDHMSDMIMNFSFFANLSYTGSEFTEHCKTNLSIIRKFLDIEVSLKGDKPFHIEIRKRVL
ncbi:RNA 3'-terminal phosphate cyclase [Metallosphaera tengchongensis]|uniref:RNA 3'-terminal phosphate cyclase n=1 Tax=Metallosphaera tengchongensis TaxID=1532350 RepID=A0A6N0NXH3_9CREN|nr:RNA 3'-terminal phosphate cyclase [Metallosphaera tengchongensis]QKR00563.1 RNA 3'-terminal phosphate cyclase [Metallosphaera tengchongensis]